MAVIDETKKSASKKPAARKPRVASVKVPASVAAPKPKAKEAVIKVKIPARLAKIIAEFAKDPGSRTESLGGKITKAQKAVLVKEAARLGLTPAVLVAALVINFLDTCAE